MHRDRSSLGPPSASTWWIGGAPARGPRWSRIVFVGDGDEAPDGGPPLVELLRSRREVEEQLHARAKASAGVGGGKSCVDCDMF